MIERIKFAEYEWFLWLNSFHSPLWDTIMFWVTYRFTWIPLYVYIIYYIFKKLKQYAWQNLAFVLLSAGLADRLTSGVMKPYFQRLRPCHDPIIQHLVHVVGDCGGQFGFVSSHAANSFALLMSFFLLTKKAGVSIKNLLTFLCFWAIIVSYSRIYVGVHFPTDVLVGGLVGVLIPSILFPFFIFINLKLQKLNPSNS